MPWHISHIRHVPVAPPSASTHFIFSDGDDDDDESQDGQNDGASSDEQDRQDDATCQGDEDNEQNCDNVTADEKGHSDCPMHARQPSG